MTEHDDLIQTLDLHRQFLLRTAEGLTEEQARSNSTVSALTIASLLKHVADNEAGWVAFAQEGASALGGDYDPDAAAEGDSEGEAVDTRFVLTDNDTLEFLRGRLEQVGRDTADYLRTADLDASQELPKAPWFEPGARWTVRRIALHLIAEMSQHAGHADIIREAIDGQHTMG